jgi:DNA polymerase-3 subunit alpha
VTALIDDTSEYSEAELQSFEHEYLGFYVTSHPLKRVANRLRFLTTHSFAEVKEASDGTNVILGGLALSIDKRLTKQNKLLAIMHMEDLTGKMEVVIYNDTLEKISADVLSPQSLLLIKGKVRKNDEGVSVSAYSVRRVSDASLVSLTMEKEKSFSQLHQLKSILIQFKGEDPVLLHFPQADRNQTVLVGSQFWVDAASESFDRDFRERLPEDVAFKVNRIRV